MRFKGQRTIRPKIGPPQNIFILTHIVGLYPLVTEYNYLRDWHIIFV